MTSPVTVTYPWGRITPDGQLRTWAGTFVGRPDWLWECLHPACRIWHTGHRTKADALAAGRDHLAGYCDRPGAPRRTQTQAGNCRPRGTETTDA